MISQLNGQLLAKHPPQIVIDVNGVAYEVDVSMQTFYALPALGENIRLFTHLVVREDAHLLFGFANQDERTTFRQLIKVSGIGAKTALGILSAMNAEELAQAVAQEDVKRLSSAPGIGKKTAERMILELRGKLVSGSLDAGLFATSAADNSNDVVDTLLALGYSEREARAAIKGIPSGTEVGEGVRLALKNLLK
ncbi:MAG: Holliday junction branch migration protein RuvA [Alysiella sp.]|uniref:Holliday junction branch migration protein RuvA n=1 Tax=Alysiella sp. TaxID=1872483 RepID=UPI0026DADC42|nr:Holliday junction branch migration protein RuvA [Alysiella sp.]MDO4434481.1 Holliday junction branch migration protein RuvA [Alysiella sp.]